ncbi:hypothetical protein ASF65_04090 [Aureimonas sp. Leaf324]|jgi:hypothetical protein|nr:hypothetical protein ASF65_04090 [Aureimonas sp. Leaf324]
MIRASDLGPGFRHIRLLAGREKGQREAPVEDGYDILAPLDADGRIDPVAWRRNPDLCRVRHFQHGIPDRIGTLRHGPGGIWYFDYEPGPNDDEKGFRFATERFVTGEYVSLQRAGAMHTYRVVRVEKP